MAARSPAWRARYAKRGLARGARLDRTTHAMLLRQLYLAHFELRRFDEALDIALQAIELEVLADVLHQDAARAAMALDDLDGALGHLRSAVRASPASRRPFHLWTLGGILFLAHRYAEAISALERAARVDTKEKPLYQAHLALAKIAGGEDVSDLQKSIDELASAACGQGYGRFVLGHLAYAAGEWDAARRYLQAFVKRTTTSRATVEIALEPEVRMARATLKKIGQHGRS
jgi:tetratricopeptide (TPR) repeat protein